MPKAKPEPKPQVQGDAGDDFIIRPNDSRAVRSLKENALTLLAHIEKREIHAKDLTGEEAAGHQQTIAEEKARLNDIRKALK